MGGAVPSPTGRTAEAEFFGGGELPQMSATVRLQLPVVAERRPAGDAEFWQRGAHDDQALHGSIEKGRKAAVRGSSTHLRNGMEPLRDTKMNIRSRNIRKTAWNN